MMLRVDLRGCGHEMWGRDGGPLSVTCWLECRQQHRWLRGERERGGPCTLINMMGKVGGVDPGPWLLPASAAAAAAKNPAQALQQQQSCTATTVPLLLLLLLPLLLRVLLSLCSYCCTHHKHTASNLAPPLPPIAK